MIGDSSFSPADSERRAAMVRAGAVGGSGAVLGVLACLTFAPSFVSANDDAGIRGVQMQDARERTYRSQPVYAPVARPAVAPRQRERFEIFQPVVRSFAPQPKPSRALPDPIQFGYGTPPSSAASDQLRPLGPLYPSLQEAVAKRKAKKRDDAPLADLSGIQSTRTVCVRLCDGYHFPVGNLGSGGDWATHSAMCKAACPAAEVRLYSLAPGAKGIEQATSREARTYASLSTAFAYRKGLDQSCTCQRERAGQYVSLLRDFTLRAGDAVVVAGKAKVFRGAAQWPYRASDFGDFRKSYQLSKQQRRQLDSMTSASLNVELLKPFTVAQVQRAADDVAVLRPEPQAQGQVRTVHSDAGRPLLRPTQGFVAVQASAPPVRMVQNRVPGFVVR
ncbi:MAG: DUF2865 domain-containing protein [Beijerinckiaceae bacterium]